MIHQPILIVSEHIGGVPMTMMVELREILSISWKPRGLKLILQFIGRMESFGYIILQRKSDLSTKKDRMEV